MEAGTKAFAATAGPAVEIHRMLPENATGVTELMHEVYGDTYPKKYVYDATLLRKMNADGELQSFVATDTGSRVIGYGSVTTYFGDPGIGLLGSLAVSPQCRGNGLGGQIARYMVDACAGQGFRCLIAGAFAAHPYSQKAAIKEGFTITAVMPGSQPQSISFRGISEQLSQRESIVFLARILATAGYGPQYLPPRHEGIIRGIVDGLGICITTGAAENPYAGPLVTAHTFNPDTGVAMVRVRAAGADTRASLADVVRECREQGAVTVWLHVDAGDPATPGVVAAAEEAGFVLTGLIPGERGLLLLLQHQDGPPVSREAIHMGCPEGERLLAYVLDQMQEKDALIP